MLWADGSGRSRNRCRVCAADVRDLLTDPFISHGAQARALICYNVCSSVCFGWAGKPHALAQGVFVQIGADDGRRNDPIHDLVTRHNLAGLAIEPLPDLFVELKKTYRRYPKVSIASLNPRHHELSGTDSRIMVQESVQAAPLQTILSARQIHSFDLFVVDTEGYDAEIVGMLLESEFRPKLIVFEHGMPHSIMTPKTFWELGGLLMDTGYDIATQEYDAIAYRP